MKWVPPNKGMKQTKPSLSFAAYPCVLRTTGGEGSLQRCVMEGA